MWQISRAIGWGLLAGLSLEDLRTRRLSGELLLIGASLAAVYRLTTKEIPGELILAGLAMGAVFLLLGYLTREALGYGDGILICILGVFVGVTELAAMLMVAWTGASVAAVILCVKRRFSRKAAMPFVPFLLLGYSIVSVCTYISTYVQV